MAQMRSVVLIVNKEKKNAGGTKGVRKLTDKIGTLMTFFFMI